MSHTTNESDDGMYSNNHNESPAADIGSGCRSRWDGSVLKKGPWTTAEDAVLIDYVKKHGEGNWNAVQKYTGLSRCGKSCRLRWANHLRPNLKKGAFSQEEEQLIVELHAKMGNKWARMAAHLPGRTDNEIKNYWNTRIKRRQRAGLPLYPPEMHVEVLQWNQEYTKSEITGVDKIPQDILQVGNCESNVFFDSLKVFSGMVPSASDLSDIPACNMLGNGATSSRYKSFMPPIMQSPKRLREAGALFPGYCSIIKDEFTSSEDFQSTAPQKISRSFSFSFPRDADPPDRNQHSSDAILGSHTLMDAVFPTSKPSFGTVKLELPSFQYPETNFDQWKAPSSPHSDLLESVDAYIQSPPPMGKAEPDCYSSCDTGLLDMLLHEAKIRTSMKNGSLSSEKSFSSTTTPDIAEGVTHGEPENKYKEFEDSLKPFAHSELSRTMQLGAGGSSSGESPSPTDNFAGHGVKLEQWEQIWTPKRENEASQVLDITRPDVILASSWLDHGLGLVKETSTMSDALVALLGDDLGNEYMHMAAAGTSSSSSSPGQARTVGSSCAWSNMPPVCQMTELP